MLFALVILFNLGFLEAQSKSESKPDLQKVYNDALTWSKTKLEDMPDAKALQDTSGIGVCHGANKQEVLEISPGCKKNAQKDIENVLDQVTSDKQDVREPQEKILVFVSFSMPSASIKALSQEAEKHHAVLVMRGLKDDSFKATQTAFQELGKDVQSGIEINPEAFETYQIKQVPVFVLVKSIQGKDPRELSRLSGNVSLSFAAKKLKEQS
jgi:type-F conjugative transfer system pilin assembly protein TrbC